MPNRFLRLLALPLSPLLFAILPTAAPGAANWEYGHQTVARIAHGAARPATRAKIRGFLGHGNLLGTPQYPVTDIASASISADCVKPL